jgi:release factor glutamine methyltransferase
MNEAELLFTQILNCKRQDLYLDRDKLLDKKNSELISGVLKKRVAGQPLQYILGKTEFMGLEFKVSPDVFIPRPETEILVETAIKVTKSPGQPVTKLNILDMGTGSGCIAISLAKLLPHIAVTATDISCAALEVARENAKLNDVSINFIQSNLFCAYELTVPRQHPIQLDESVSRLPRNIGCRHPALKDGPVSCLLQDVPPSAGTVPVFRRLKYHPQRR